jgi:epoxyqueuosine reductase
MIANILLHSCCGPCTIVPVRQIRAEGSQCTAFFFNPNIHPYQEYKKRRDTLIELCNFEQMPFHLKDEYGLKDFLRQVVFNENNRCPLCYAMRLEATAAFAAKNNYTSFSSTLLYSKYQNHEKIIEICSGLAEKYHIDFYYRDFREGWQEGIELSKERQMYRQSYCGCIYSEQERYDKSLANKR